MRDSACPTSPHLHPRWRSVVRCYHFFFFNDTATTEIYTLPLHDALPISTRLATRRPTSSADRCSPAKNTASATARRCRSEEHTSELQSQSNLVCRLLLEKKKREALERLGIAARPFLVRGRQSRCHAPWAV